MVVAASTCFWEGHAALTVQQRTRTEAGWVPGGVHRAHAEQPNRWSLLGPPLLLGPGHVPAPNTGCQGSQSGFNENLQGLSRPDSLPAPAASSRDCVLGWRGSMHADERWDSSNLDNEARGFTGSW